MLQFVSSIKSNLVQRYTILHDFEIVLRIQFKDSPFRDDDGSILGLIPLVHFFDETREKDFAAQRWIIPDCVFLKGFH